MPDKVVLISDGTDNCRKETNWLNSVTEDTNHIPVACVYAAFNDMDGDGIGVAYLYINCTSEGTVESVAISYATGDSASYTEFTYDSSTGYWVHSAT